MTSSPAHSPPNLSQLLSNITSQFQLYKANFTSQVHETFTHLAPKDVIRLVIIAGAYALLRPYLIKIGARFQARDHEREIDYEEIHNMRKSEGYSKDGLKGRVQIPDDTDSDSGQEEVAAGSTRTGTDWGKTARRRQRRVMRLLLEAEEKRRLEDEEAESDKELEQFMTG